MNELNVLCGCFCSLSTWLLRTLHIKSTPREAKRRKRRGGDAYKRAPSQRSENCWLNKSIRRIKCIFCAWWRCIPSHFLCLFCVRCVCVCEQSHVVKCRVRDSMSSFLSFVLSFSDASFDCWVNCVGCRSVIIQFTKWCLKLSLRFAKMQKWKTNDEWTTNTTLFSRCTLHTQSYIFSRV